MMDRTGVSGKNPEDNSLERGSYCRPRPPPAPKNSRTIRAIRESFACSRVSNFKFLPFRQTPAPPPESRIHPAPDGQVRLRRAARRGRNIFLTVFVPRFRSNREVFFDLHARKTRRWLSHCISPELFLQK